MRIQSIAKVRQGVEPGAVHLINDLHQKERVFTHRIVILKMHHDVPRGSVFDDLPKAFRQPLEVGLCILGSRNVGTNTGGSDSHRYIDPLFAIGNGLFTFGVVSGVRAVLAIHGDIRYARVSLLDRRAKFR